MRNVPINSIEYVVAVLNNNERVYFEGEADAMRCSLQQISEWLDSLPEEVRYPMIFAEQEAAAEEADQQKELDL
jgi:hypothetical protein